MVARIGVLAIQGDFSLHCHALDAVGAEPVEVRRASELTGLNGIIIPGGESTTLHKLLAETELGEPLLVRLRGGMPVWGTCAGAILLGHGKDRPQPRWNLIDVDVVRNAYGRQVDSFVTPVKFAGIDDKFPGVFIRAPKFTNIGNEVEPLAVINGNTVAARQKKVFVTAFHPELTDDVRIHRYFVEMTL